MAGTRSLPALHDLDRASISSNNKLPESERAQLNGTTVYECKVRGSPVAIGGLIAA